MCLRLCPYLHPSITLCAVVGFQDMMAHKNMSVGEKRAFFKVIHKKQNANKF